jgi:hypothetical protein
MHVTLGEEGSSSSAATSLLLAFFLLRSTGNMGLDGPPFLLLPPPLLSLHFSILPGLRIDLCIIRIDAREGKHTNKSFPLRYPLFPSIHLLFKATHPSQNAPPITNLADDNRCAVLWGFSYSKFSKKELVEKLEEQ